MPQTYFYLIKQLKNQQVTSLFVWGLVNTWWTTHNEKEKQTHKERFVAHMSSCKQWISNENGCYGGTKDSNFTTSKKNWRMIALGNKKIYLVIQLVHPFYSFSLNPLERKSSLQEIWSRKGKNISEEHKTKNEYYINSK